MFEEQPSLNGDGYTTNAHCVRDYEDRPLKPAWDHLMWDSELGRYIEKPGSNIAHRTKDQVFRHIGERTGTMSFTTELAGPGDRDDLGSSMNAAVPTSPRKGRR
jgi:hypothetical protein